MSLNQKLIIFNEQSLFLILHLYRFRVLSKLLIEIEENLLKSEINGRIYNVNQIHLEMLMRLVTYEDECR